ncbi:DUF4105 domain-containing protein [Flavobacterium psychrophilum]|uniref:lipoprotein N-acyltransferase Lnb domain-containing protein n=1 Tax=Flavobacterium psychrophilum TaxID=96345 RepID=UPI000B7C082E|nr:DUF4105 domain-containing protein [Flavobacterium psychrophilum]MCB6061195.1 DUF4105 domain-containing protein [Flavobacterium psychrophilum]SNA68659.1 conserved membrane hypothetical protein [Flavobacterium psychrophilum]SNB09012.1 conserved membrane hypothetical protein [Flavobacterium psychrophilum]SNB26445.1 conserved membrane hypothetical protein [Flavobacterium psychrophilum]
MTKKILLLLSLIQFSISYCQQLTISESTKVSIITVGVADEVHSLYGHTALRIQDYKSNFDLVYNYGMFDFATENFVAKFAKGNLQYYAAAYPYADFEYNYREDNRSIYEQVLNFSFLEKQSLFNKLNASLLPENTFYTYKFIDRNCTTKVIDIVNEVLENKPIAKKNRDHTTYREVLFPYAKNHFYEQLGINIIFGQKADNQATTIFLPLDLFDNLKTISYKNEPLVSETNTIFEANRTTPVSYLDSIYSLIIILLLFVVLNKKATNIIYFSVLGLIGLLFSFMSIYSFHKELFWNYNILLLNPLFLFLVFFIIKNNTKWIKKTSLLCFLCLGSYCIYMFGKIHFIIVLPIIIATFVLLLRMKIKK